MLRLGIIIMLMGFSFISEAKTLVFYLGGNNSCKGGNPPESVSVYQDFLKPILKNYEVDLAVACFEGSDVVKYVKNGELKQFGWEKYRCMSHVLDANPDIDNVLVVGFSYGAWIGMKLLESSDFENIPLYLVTIDAISRTDCRFSGPWKGCKRFPSDVDQGAVRADAWIHFYQRKDLFLQSDEAHLADRNVEIRGVKHTDMNDHPLVWEAVREFIDAHMGQH